MNLQCELNDKSLNVYNLAIIITSDKPNLYNVIARNNMCPSGEIQICVIECIITCY